MRKHKCPHCGGFIKFRQVVSWDERRREMGIKEWIPCPHAEETSHWMALSTRYCPAASKKYWIENETNLPYSP